MTDRDLQDYIKEIVENFYSLRSNLGLHWSENLAMTIISQAVSMYNADHINQNLSATIKTQEGEIQ